MAIWLMPVWCALIILLAYWPARHHDDAFWYAATGLPAIAFAVCVSRRRWILAWYSLAIAIIVLAIGLAVPGFAHAMGW